MSEYLITRRDNCDKCGGTGGYSPTDGNLTYDVDLPCNKCQFKGYIDTPCDLIEVLSKLHFQFAPSELPDKPRRQFKNLRIVEDEG